jgi:alanyl-tRNA synthetase
LEKEFERMRGAAVLAGGSDMAQTATDESGVAVVAHRAPDGASADDLRRLALDVRGRLEAAGPAVVAVAAVTDGKPIIVVTVNDSARERGLRAGALVREASGALGGGGGGRDDLAQGGGDDPGALDAVLRDLPSQVGRQAANHG